MHYIIEQELSQVPDDWDLTLQTLGENHDLLMPGFATGKDRQIVVIGEGGTEELSQWGARTLSLISHQTIWATSEKALLQVEDKTRPPRMTAEKTLFLFLTRRGGDLRSLELCQKLDHWLPQNQKIVLASCQGLLTEHLERSIVFGSAEHSSVPTVTPTRLMVAVMALGAHLTERDVLAKRAALLKRWYIRPAGTHLARLTGQVPANIVVASPKRLEPLCQPLAKLVSQYSGSEEAVIDLDNPEPPRKPSLILGITGKSSEREDLQNLAHLQQKGSKALAFSSNPDPSKKVGENIALSPRLTDLGRSIHALLCSQHLLLAGRVRRTPA